VADIIDFTPEAQGIGLTLGSTGETEPRINRVDFGDGYVQRSGDGINTMGLKLNAMFTNLTKSERDYVINFFQERGGYKAFRFSAGAWGTRKFICKKWAETPRTPIVFDIQAEFEEVFDV